MRSQADRVNTMVALINSSSFCGRTIKNKVKAEFHQVNAVKTVTPTNRRNILKILHSTRALDTTLNSFLAHHGILGSSHSIGQYISTLAGHSNAGLGKISVRERDKYQAQISRVRNKYLHNADTYPHSETEVYQLISEMEALISRVAAL